jgi:hypothetical protein
VDRPDICSNLRAGAGRGTPPRSGGPSNEHCTRASCKVSQRPTRLSSESISAASTSLSTSPFLAALPPCCSRPAAPVRALFVCVCVVHACVSTADDASSGANTRLHTSPDSNSTKAPTLAPQCVHASCACVVCTHYVEGNHGNLFQRCLHQDNASIVGVKCETCTRALTISLELVPSTHSGSATSRQNSVLLNELPGGHSIAGKSNTHSAASCLLSGEYFPSTSECGDNDAVRPVIAVRLFFSRSSGLKMRAKLVRALQGGGSRRASQSTSPLMAPLTSSTCASHGAYSKPPARRLALTPAMPPS